MEMCRSKEYIGTVTYQSDRLLTAEEQHSLTIGLLEDGYNCTIKDYAVSSVITVWKCREPEEDRIKALKLTT